MSNIGNELGFGSLASVAWSDMSGTDLTQSQLEALNAEISTDTTISAVLIELITGAVALGTTSFRLSDLSDAFQFTNINTASPERDDNANDWAVFISRVTGNSLSASTDLSLSEWRRVAAELQNHASQQASKRDPNGAGGGIKSVNGNWFINGQEVSLLDAYMAVRVNQVANFDDSLNIYIAELNRNNKLIQAANEFLSLLRATKPQSDDNLPTFENGHKYRYISPAQMIEFEAKWGVQPIREFLPNLPGATVGGGYAGYVDNNVGFGTQNVTDHSKYWDGWIENVKGYVDTKDTANQTVQQKLEQMTNRRSEVLDGLTSFAKSQTQTGSVFARNLG
jgi:hypothetical protein